MIDRGKKRNSARAEKSTLAESTARRVRAQTSGRGYAVVLPAGFACGDVGAPVFIHYERQGAAQFSRALREHGMRGRVVRVEWAVKELRP